MKNWEISKIYQHKRNYQTIMTKTKLQRTTNFPSLSSVFASSFLGPDSREWCHRQNWPWLGSLEDRKQQSRCHPAKKKKTIIFSSGQDRNPPKIISCLPTSHFSLYTRLPLDATIGHPLFSHETVHTKKCSAHAFILMQIKLIFKMQMTDFARGGRFYPPGLTIWRKVFLRPRPHYAGGIWKRSFISSVRPSVHTNPSRKRSFWETLIKPEKFENTGFSFSCGWNAFWKRSFSKTMASR